MHMTQKADEHPRAPHQPHLICKDAAADAQPFQQQQEVDAHELVGFERLCGAAACCMHLLRIHDCQVAPRLRLTACCAAQG